MDLDQSSTYIWT